MNRGGRFRFSLETVLKVRGLREEQAKLQVALAEKELERTHQALDQTRERRRKLVADLDSGVKEWTPQDFSIFKTYLEHLKITVDDLQKRIGEQETEVQQKREVLKQRYQERRLLEKLREKHYAHFRREMRKLMENETEAIVLGRWGH
jgi:flagellar export protein FliJ